MDRPITWRAGPAAKRRRLSWSPPSGRDPAILPCFWARAMRWRWDLGYSRPRCWPGQRRLRCSPRNSRLIDAGFRIARCSNRWRTIIARRVANVELSGQCDGRACAKAYGWYETQPGRDASAEIFARDSDWRVARRRSMDCSPPKAGRFREGNLLVDAREIR